MLQFSEQHKILIYEISEFLLHENFLTSRDGHMLRQGVALATLDFSIFFNIYTKATKEGEEEEGSYKLL
jgi:hypothetical protein